MSAAADTGGIDYWAEPGYLASVEDDDPGPDEGPDGPAEKVFEHLVERAVRKMQVTDEARRRLRSEHAADRPIPSLLADFLAVDDPPVAYRINGLLPVGGRALLAAQYKAGKTTLVANLVRALADGDRFLDRDVNIPAGRVVLIDDELDESMLRRWFRDQAIHRADRVAVVPLRGRLSSFNILDATVRADWAADLAALEPAVIILDCLRPILDALGLDEDKEAGLVLVAFDELMRETGATEAVVVHHMGHTGERSRGSSRLRDWPDVEWRLVRRDPDDPASPRFFSAYGRDVDSAEAEIGYDPTSRQIRVVGGSRREAEVTGLVPTLVAILQDRPALTARECEQALIETGAARAAARAAVKKALQDGAVVTAYGRHRSTLHYAANTASAKDRGSAPPTLFGVSAGPDASAPPDDFARSDDVSAGDPVRRPDFDENPSSEAQCASAPQCAEINADQCASAPPTGERRTGELERTQDGGELNCTRCHRRADRLVVGRCPACAYPAGEAPDDEHEQ